MGRYVIRRLIQTIPVFFGTTFIIFSAVFALPGDPVRALFGDRQPPQTTIDAITRKYNLDKPLLTQYGLYMKGLFLHGNFGVNFRDRPVLDIMKEAWPVSVKLGLTAFAFEVLIGVTAGIFAGLRRGGFFDNLTLMSTTIIISIPTFVLGFIGQLTLGLKLKIFPVAGLQDGWPYSYLLPALILAGIQLAALTRLVRTSLVENLRADYVRTAIAKGLSRKRVVGRHAFRNSLIPVVTLLGVDVGSLISGAIVTEGIFNLPGVGRALFLAIRAQENTVVVGISTALVLIFIFANLAVDLLYGLLDPRIRYE